jgi:hypothetical protein
MGIRDGGLGVKQMVVGDWAGDWTGLKVGNWRLVWRLGIRLGVGGCGLGVRQEVVGLGVEMGTGE